MKELTLVRHAKSSWKDPKLDDHERPLNKRGERDAPMIGSRLAKRNYSPDLIISSPAVRALETATIFAEKLGYRRKKIVVEGSVYAASVDDLLGVVRSLDDSVIRVMLFGHNPGLTELANCLGPRPIGNIPTCGVVQLEFDTDNWARVGGVAAKEILYEFPKG
jgi:phosphohistidine phosphatase